MKSQTLRAGFWIIAGLYLLASLAAQAQPSLKAVKKGQLLKVQALVTDLNEVEIRLESSRNETISRITDISPIITFWLHWDFRL